MKKLLFFTALFMLIFSTVVFAGVEELTDADYLKDDFGYNDYKDYITDSVDNKGYMWPAGTTVIHYESPQNPYKDISNTSPSPKIPDSTVIIGFRAFENRNFDTVNLDLSYLKNLKYIGENAFNNSFRANFSRVDLSGTKIVRIGERAFNGCFMKTLVLPDTIKRIDGYAFVQLKDSNLVLPEGLEYIGDGAFSNLSNPTIPRSVKYIGYNAFGFDALCHVYEGSYAEEWCKANGRNYIYIKEEPKASSEQLTSAASIGPVTFSGYIGNHRYLSVKDELGEQTDVMFVNIVRGGKMTADVDGVEFMYTPVAWHTELENGIGTSDNVFDIYPEADKYTILKSVKDLGLIPHLSTKLEDGTWSKGLSWEFNWDIMGPVDIVVAANGRNYRYRIFVYDPDAKVAPANDIKNAVPTASKVIIDGKEVSFDAYNIEGNNYFKLRDVAHALSGSVAQFNVTWNDKSKCIDMLSNAPYTPVGGELALGDGLEKSADSTNPSQLLKDGVAVFAKSYNINGNNYFKLRDLGREFNFGVSWDGASNCILIETNKAYTEE
ncbi:MAG: leucine-rich repeat domain-containing protein [Clostridia bacterium]|nr:leucine-rich repeat domain-containing protein [Clostridia bacterium]